MPSPQLVSFPINPEETDHERTPKVNEGHSSSDSPSDITLRLQPTRWDTPTKSSSLETTRASRHNVGPGTSPTRYHQRQSHHRYQQTPPYPTPAPPHHSLIHSPCGKPMMTGWIPLSVHYCQLSKINTALLGTKHCP